jgi:cytochrome oxidase Cu insertion factor (SCO1/SenC/PrrC family)
MEEEEIKKKLKELDREALSHKMARLMVLMVKSDPEDDQLVEYTHVMKNFTKEEMAFIVIVHAATSIQEAIGRMPEVGGMIDALTATEELKRKIKNDD